MNAPAELPELQAVRLQLDDIPECVRLSSNSFDAFHSRPEAVVRWFDARIRHNPWQSALTGIGVGFRAQGELVAFRAMFAQPWWLQGRTETVAFAAHTAVSSRLRGRGVGGRLIEASRACARITGSTSAGDITQKSYARQGFTPIAGADNDFYRWRISLTGSMQSRLGAIGGGVAGRLANLSLWLKDRRLGSTAGWLAEPLVRCGDEVESLWHRERATQISCLARSRQYLQWRLFEQPTADLHATALRDPSGALRALAVWAVQSYSRFVRAAVLRDLMVADADEATLHRLLRLLAGNWRDNGCSWASLEVSAPRLTAAFRSLGFEHVPSRGNRYWISATPPLAPLVLEPWLRSGLDGDYFDAEGAEPSP